VRAGPGPASLSVKDRAERTAMLSTAERAVFKVQSWLRHALLRARMRWQQARYPLLARDASRRIIRSREMTASRRMFRRELAIHQI